jgi:hypothetical protein
VEKREYLGESETLAGVASEDRNLALRVALLQEILTQTEEKLGFLHVRLASGIFVLSNKSEVKMRYLRINPFREVLN